MEAEEALPAPPSALSRSLRVVRARERGVDAEHLLWIDTDPELFELFYRDPDSARTVAGSGIGLFVCASLVQAMGGRTWAARRPEGGTEFGFTMRVLEADEQDLDDGRGAAATDVATATTTR